MSGQAQKNQQMKKFKIFMALLFACFIFSGCKEKGPTYDTIIFYHDDITVYHKFSSGESENEKYFLLEEGRGITDFDRDKLSHSDSLTIFATDIPADDAEWAVKYCDRKNIPVFFMNCEVDKELIDSYDKAFCIKTDFLYAGEVFANHIKDIWKEGLSDNDENQIFSFAVITPETVPADYQAFYDSFLKEIELIGIPLEQKDMIFLSRGDVLPYCNENQGECEAFILLSQEYLALAYQEYEPYGEGVEILGMSMGNHISNEFINTCYIDFADYFLARNIVLNNIKNKLYPFTDFDYSFIDKNIYIQPVI